MPPVPALRRASLAAVLFLAAAAAQASVAFHVTVDTDRVIKPGASSSLPASASTGSDVVLGPHGIRVREGRRLSVLDFAARRRYVIDTAAATYDAYSLFDTVGFRAAELRQRQGIAGALQAGGVALQATPPVYEEQALSVAAGRRRGPLQPNVLDGAVLWSLDKQPLLCLGIAGTPVSDDDARAFAQFLRYTWGGHPLVLAMLAGGKQIPADFTLHYQDVAGSVTRRFRVSQVRTDAPDDFSLAAYRPRPVAAGAPELERVLAQAARLAPLDAQLHLALRAEAERLFAAQQPFQAFLLMLEDNLSTGALVDQLSREQRLALETCEPAHQLLRALSAKDQDAIGAGLASVQALRAQADGQQPVLQVFEANLRGKLGQWPAATALYLQVLQARPRLTGAYKDLGDALYAQSDMPNAWRSWDAGRALVPAHRLFAGVNRLEQGLLRDYPAFFDGGEAAAQPSTSRPASSTKTVGSTNLP